MQHYQSATSQSFIALVPLSLVLCTLFTTTRGTSTSTSTAGNGEAASSKPAAVQRAGINKGKTCSIHGFFQRPDGKQFACPAIIDAHKLRRQLPVYYQMAKTTSTN